MGARVHTLLITFSSILFIIGGYSTQASAQEGLVPDWIRQNAIWWGEGLISTQEYLNGISFLIEDEVIEVPGFVNVQAQTLEEQSAAELWSAIDNLQNQVDELKKQTPNFDQTSNMDSQFPDPECWRFNEKNIANFDINRDVTGDGKVDERDCITPKIYLRATSWEKVSNSPMEIHSARCDDGDIVIGGTWIWGDPTNIANKNKKYGPPVEKWLSEMDYGEYGLKTQSMPKTGFFADFNYFMYGNEQYHDIYSGTGEPLPIVRLIAVCAHLGNILQYAPTTDDEVLVGSGLTNVTPDPFDTAKGLEDAEPELRDDDGDGIPNFYDNCVKHVNRDQEDFDEDGIGDTCDSCPQDFENDIDSDLYCVGASNSAYTTRSFDNCPNTWNFDQKDSDGDGIGDACDRADPLESPRGSLDSDGDGILDSVDKCPTTPEDKNGYQDTDGCPDGRGS